MYAPSLGRFMQTDPIGYADGPNWYNYAHSEPVNNVDPSGLDPCPPNSTAGRGCDPTDPSGTTYVPGNPGGTTVVTNSGGDLPGVGPIRPGSPVPPNPMPQKPNTPARKSVPCDSLLTQPGNIAVGGITATAVVGGGITGGYGKFRNLQTGATGSYFTAGSAVGYEVSGGGAGTIYPSLSDLDGFGASINLQVGNFTASFNFNNSGFVSSSVGASVPGSPAGASAGAGGTHLFACTVPAG